MIKLKFYIYIKSNNYFFSYLETYVFKTSVVKAYMFKYIITNSISTNNKITFFYSNPPVENPNSYSHYCDCYSNDSYTLFVTEFSKMVVRCWDPLHWYGEAGGQSLCTYTRRHHMSTK